MHNQHTNPRQAGCDPFAQQPNGALLCHIVCIPGKERIIQCGQPGQCVPFNDSAQMQSAAKAKDEQPHGPRTHQQVLGEQFSHGSKLGTTEFDTHSQYQYVDCGHNKGSKWHCFVIMHVFLCQFFRAQNTQHRHGVTSHQESRPPQFQVCTMHGF